ncbi:molecular chaperone GrpE [Cronobacter muytjensii]|nr:molecular chaperone GrpE [Cronobacter muytjensii]NCI15595.1 molecular chaperone GrpE [Cronobacter muytjensii]
MADNTDAVEMVIHFPGRPYRRGKGDNLSASLETRKLIPIIIQVSDTNA